MFDTSVVTSSAKWIASTLIEEGKYLYGVEDTVRELQRELDCMKQYLQDADADANVPQQGDGQLRIFTKNIQELAFRAEDAVDAYILDVSSKIQYRSFFSKLACIMCLSWPIHQLRKEIEDILEDVQKANERLQKYSVKLNVGEGSGSRPVVESGVSPVGNVTENYVFLQNQMNVVGIDEVTEELAQHLANSADGSRVLGIVGTGGAGKTTLATKLYHHPLVASCFTHKAFVTVSQKWSGSNLLRNIFKQVACSDSSTTSVTELVQELGQFLEGKQCLIVLDDVWEEKAWDDICPALPTNKGSKVVLTTREQHVPLHADTKCTVHEPKLLTEEQKWELFSKIAIEGRTAIEKNVEFEKLGRAMLEKCDGLPLTVVTLAGILRTKQHLYQWEDVKKALYQDILKGNATSNYGVVSHMISLSYNYLPAHIKPCFLYLAIFPEDYEIRVSMLIKMWIAEGFIAKDLERGQETDEDVARKLVDELTESCMVQVLIRNYRGKIETCRLHDIIREFCIAKAKELHFVDIVSSTDPEVNATIQARQVSIVSSQYCLTDNQHLRTLVRLSDFNMYSSNIRKLEAIDEKFKLLRVLNIWYIKHVDLPKQIGNLIHLRYLCIRQSRISGLPKSIRNLKNLLYFYCGDSSGARRLPDNLVCKMEKLRKLYLGIRPNVKSLGLANLRSLQSFNVIAGGWMIKELPRLSCTLQKMEICEIETEEELEAIYQCPVIVEDRLSKLMLHAGNLGFDLRKLKHCERLWGLHLVGYIARDSWVSFPPNLVKLELRNSHVKEDDFIEALGQLPCLQSLWLRMGSFDGRQLSCKANAFPKLMQLVLDNLDLEEWKMEEGAMSCLNKLEIGDCCALKRLPESLKSITTLKDLGISLMSKEFCRRLGYGGSEAAEDSHIIQHIPSVRFIHVRECFVGSNINEVMQ